MKTNKCNLSTACVIAFVAIIVAIIVALPGRLHGQTAAAKSTGGDETSATGWSVQVDQVDPGNLGLAYSFQIAIYENLVEELNKTKQFQQVFRDGDVRAVASPNLLVLKTTVEKYTPGSETRRAVTTVSGATKLAVRSQLLTREGKVIFERTVNGDVRLFGSNLRATHNLAHNIAKTIKQSSWSGSGQQTSESLEQTTLAPRLSDPQAFSAAPADNTSAVFPLLARRFHSPQHCRAPFPSQECDKPLTRQVHLGQMTPCVPPRVWARTFHI